MFNRFSLFQYIKKYGDESLYLFINDNCHLCHGDLTRNNICVNSYGKIKLIDLETMCYGSHIYDRTRLYVKEILDGSDRSSNTWLLYNHPHISNYIILWIIFYFNTARFKKIEQELQIQHISMLDDLLNKYGTKLSVLLDYLDALANFLKNNRI